MSGPSTIDLVSAVSNAGGVGVLGADSYSSKQLRNSIRKIKTKTSFPFGINLLIPNKGTFQAKQYIQVQNLLNDIRRDINIDIISDPNKIIPFTNANEKIDDEITSEKIDIILEEKVPLISFGLGDPTPFVKTIHDSDTTTKIMTMVSTVDEALHVAKNGVDIIIAQGSEAGGHRSTLQTHKVPPLIGTVSLIPQMVDSLSKEANNDDGKESIPVIASGGITDGRGLAAAVCLGASGVSIGTRFLLAKESSVFKAYREKLLRAKETDVVITNTFSGIPARAIKNKIIKKFENSKINPLPWPIQWTIAEDIYKACFVNNNIEYYPLLAGQSIRLLTREQTASEIVKEIIKEFENIISNLKNSN